MTILIGVVVDAVCAKLHNPTGLCVSAKARAGFGVLDDVQGGGKRRAMSLTAASARAAAFAAADS